VNIQKYIKTYNQPGNLLVITNYPRRGEGIHSAKIGGVSGFAKNTLIPLAEKFARNNRKIIVLADILDRPAVYEENDMLIVRAWQRDTPVMYIQLLLWMVRFWRCSDVFVEFEFATFGDFATTSLLPGFLGIVRLFGKRLTIAIHQVITDLWSITGHIGLDFDSREFKLFSALLPVYYFLLTHLSHQTIVLEDQLLKRLIKIAPKDSIYVIPHGIEERVHLPSKKKSRKILGLDPDEFIVTSFGFITWYKGTDLLLELLHDPATIRGKPVRLLIAGGESTSQKRKAHYQKFFTAVCEKARGKKHITMTGFVPENKISLYLAASDVVVFPYRTVMSSSGPLSLAITHKKPILLSSSMRVILNSSDIKIALKESKLSTHMLLLPYSRPSFLRQLARITKPFYQAKVKRFARAIMTKRSFTNQAPTYYTVLTPREQVAAGYVSRPAFR
jgi:glycosyltransferase involved in cell wall biosynthesis